MKERYNKLFNSIAPKMSNDELLRTVLGKAEKKTMTKKFSIKKTIIIPIAAVLGLSATAVTAGAIYDGIQYIQRSKIAQNKGVAEKIQSFIYEDSNGNIKMTVEEYLSDGLAAFMTIHYEALTEDGKKWLNNFEKMYHNDLSMHPKFDDWKYAVSNSYGNRELTEYRTETDRYFRLETEMSTRSYGGKEITLNYLLGSVQKTVDLKADSNVEVYRYELKSEENPTDLFTPKYLEISDISFSILGMNHKVYKEERKKRGYSVYSILPEDFDCNDYLDTTLIMNDGSEIFIGSGGWKLGSLRPLEENYFTDLSICSGAYYVFDEKTQKWHYESVEAENVKAVKLCGATYELIPME